MTKKDCGYRKSALTKQGGFTPARQGMQSGIGVVSDQPKKPQVKQQ